MVGQAWTTPWPGEHRASLLIILQNCIQGERGSSLKKN